MKNSAATKPGTVVTIPPSGKLKIVLLVLAFIIVGTLLWYTHQLVQQLSQKEHEVADLYARSLEYIINGKSNDGEYSFIFTEVLKTIDFPLILTDPAHEPLEPYSSNTRNIQLDPALSKEQQHAYLKNLLKEFDAIHPPLKVAYQDTIVLSYVHFGESSIVTTLRWLPYIELGVAAIFLLIAYISFSYVKRSEQSNIWVGMARETAHQLGTPISGLLGWLDVLKEQASDNPAIVSTLSEMENDIQRLQKIAGRFSKIGAKSELQREDVCEIIHTVITYFERRIPHLKRFEDETQGIQLQFDGASSAFALINGDLFEWVIENLTKNALDAIETAPGIIRFTVSEERHFVVIDISDTGKGIEPKHRKDVFKPGFSTKRRGWGLGLSLAKRIVETYHHGKLTLRENAPGFSTTFRIKLHK
ncbi:MAG TPA: HAMP domain-containing sensor histidine kinase [Bacteroidota bacterium]|nr:HAMP domain-containing sensor histidine kinase [Bacteroidota bacterium]